MNLKSKIMTIAVILLMCFYVLIIIHRLYKIEDKLDRIEQSLYQIDDIISDIKDFKKAMEE